MAIEIHLPDIGTDAADVTEILVSIDEQIEVDTPLISVEGDKAAMEIPSPNSGTVKEIKLAVGDSVSTGTLILMLEPNEEEPTKIEDTTASEEKKANEPKIVSKNILLPDIGSDEVNVTEIHVATGDEVQIEQPIISVEGEKAAMEIPSTHSGKVTEVKVTVGESISTGTLLLIMETVESPDSKKVKSTASPALKNQQLKQEPCLLYTSDAADEL